MTYGEFIRQTNAFDGAVADRYSAFEMLLAEEMQAGVEQFRKVLNIYNQSAKDEAHGQCGLFEPRTPEDIKNEIIQKYERKQPTDNGNAGEPARSPEPRAAEPPTEQPTAEPIAEQRTEGEQPESRPATAQTESPLPSPSASNGQESQKPTFIDAVKALVEKGKAAASEIFQRSFFDVAKTPDFMKELGLTGEKFTIKYGFISRHFGKDESHNLPIDVWEQLP